MKRTKSPSIRSFLSVLNLKIIGFLFCNQWVSSSSITIKSAQTETAYRICCLNHNDFQRAAGCRSFNFLAFGPNVGFDGRLIIARERDLREPPKRHAGLPFENARLRSVHALRCLELHRPARLHETRERVARHIPGPLDIGRRRPNVVGRRSQKSAREHLSGLCEWGSACNVCSACTVET